MSGLRFIDHSSREVKAFGRNAGAEGDSTVIPRHLQTRCVAIGMEGREVLDERRRHPKSTSRNRKSKHSCLKRSHVAATPASPRRKGDAGVAATVVACEWI